MSWYNARQLRRQLIKLREWYSRVLFGGITIFCRRMDENSNSILVVAPHYDDETFGCGGLIALKKEQGRAVKVVFLTDGLASHKHIRTTSPQQLMAVREQEAIHAATILGLSTAELVFLRYPDGELRRTIAQNSSGVAERISALLQEFNPDEVYITCAWDNHSDHEAAFDILGIALKKLEANPDIYQYPISAGWRFVSLRRFSMRDLLGIRILPIQGVLERKRKAISVYRSQLEVLPQGFTRRFLLPHEIYFKVCSSEFPGAELLNFAPSASASGGLPCEK